MKRARTCGDGDDCVSNLVAEVSLSGFLHLAKDHSGDFFRCESTILALVFNDNGGFSVLGGNLEWPVLHVTLDFGIIHLATDETFGVKDSVGRVGVESVLGRVTDTVSGMST